MLYVILAYSSRFSPVYITTAAPQPNPSLLSKLFYKSEMPFVHLDERFPDLPEVQPTTFSSPDQVPQVSTLKNGIRVISTETNSPLTNIGVYVEAGSRYENHHNTGITDFLQHMALKSTESRSDFRLVRETSKIGANIHCTSSRELFVYNAEVLKGFEGYVMDSLSDVIQNSVFDELELKDAKDQYAKDSEARSQDAIAMVYDRIHEAAYFNNTLGLPQYANNNTLSAINSENLKEHMNSFFAGDRMVIGAVGIKHQELVDLVDGMFGYLPSTSSAPAKEAANYTGGEVRVHKPELAGDGLLHLALGFETASCKDEADLAPMCVLQTMMGGGGTFSQGGPGKGMHSRLYTQVLAQHGWVDHASAFDVVYSDSSLFGFHGACLPQDAGHMVNVFTQEAEKMTKTADVAEVTRAKNALKAQVYMSMEQQAVQLEDMCQNLITYGQPKPLASVASQIDKVTPDDVARVAKKMLKTPVSVAAAGDCTFLPRYDTIANGFQQ